MNSKLFRSIVEDAPEPIFIHTDEKFAYLNPAACRLFGVKTPEEMIGFPVVDYVHPGYRELALERIRLLYEHRDRKLEAVEQRILRKDGPEVWIESSGKPIIFNGRKGGLIFVRDISRRKKMEISLRESEEKYRKLFRNHAAVKLIIDPSTGNIVDANDTAARFYGWSVEELKQMNISRINILSDQEVRSEMELARRAQNNHFNFRHRMADGTIKDVEVFSSSVIMDDKEFLHSIIHDVTEKKRAERQLVLLSRSVEQSPVSVLITDIHGTIEYVNPGFERTTGYSFEEVKGKNPRILKSGHQSPEFYHSLWTTILSGKDWTGEFRNRKKSGELYWEQTVISPILNSKGKVTNFVSIREDITERKKMMEDLVAAKEKAEESHRLKSAFLANMSHEIRTPMNGILGFAEILKSPDLSGEQQQKFVSIIESSGRRMLDTVNDLIDISKIETGQVKMYISETNLQEQLENLYQFFKPQAQQKNLELILKDPVPEECAVLKTDRSKLDSVLTNFIKNAIKFTDQGKIEIGCIKKEGFLEYYVTDTGIGVPENRQKSIFNRFEQANVEDEKAFQGSGLGLSIAKSYVEMLGGEIRLISGKGQGSIFSFTLPCTCAAAAPKIKETGQKRSSGTVIPELKGKHILLTEDDPFSREMMIYLLERTGATVKSAWDGIETMELFRLEKFDIVLLDIQLPKISGYEVLKRIKEIDPDAVVVAQSAYAMLDDIRKFREAGFTDYLTKPIRQKNLYDLLSRYLSQEHPVQQSPE